MSHYRVTLADVIAAHDEALAYGGRSGVISLDAIQSAIGRPYSGYHRAIHRKAAALLHALVQNHGVRGRKQAVGPDRYPLDDRTQWLSPFIDRQGPHRRRRRFGR